MRYLEASKFGGPEVLTVIEKETPRPGEGILLVEVKAAIRPESVTALESIRLVEAVTSPACSGVS